MSDKLTELPTIIKSGNLPEMTHEALAAVKTRNDPAFMFVRGGHLVRVMNDELGMPRIDVLKKEGLRTIVARCAQFLRLGTNGTAPTLPPYDVMNDILEVGNWDVPPLEGITECPVMHADGQIATVQGYDLGTRLYFHAADGLEIPNIPQDPGQGEIDAAIGLLDEIITDFPFDGEASRANALAAIITPVVRPLIGGNVPLALIDKPQAGTGATLLAETIGLIATGRTAALMTAPRDDDSWRKAITAQLDRGATVITIDNLDGALWAPSLAAAITATTWMDRRLRETSIIEVKQRATWLATGNNVKLRGDLPRRCYWVRMDAQQARPWQRTGFKHPDLLKWVTAKRGEILAAVFTLCRAWIRAGRPKADGLPVLGGFNEWADMLGGILHLAGAGGFLGNLEQLYDEADEEGPAWSAFLVAWQERWPTEAVTTKQIAAELCDGNGLAEALPDDLGDVSDKGFTRKLGRALAKRQNVRYPNGLYIEKSGTYQRAVQWRVNADGELYEFPELFSNQPNIETQLDGKQKNSFDSQTHTVDAGLERF